MQHSAVSLLYLKQLRAHFESRENSDGKVLNYKKQGVRI